MTSVTASDTAFLHYLSDSEVLNLNSAT